MHKWKQIWANKTLPDRQEPSDVSVLSTLMALDGFDSGFNALTETHWHNYTNYIKHKLEIKENDTIFEVGCGAGAFLYPFYLSGNKIGGIDYSDALIKAARKYMPEGDFRVSEAIRLDTSNQYDFVVSNGVFLYFESIDYAENVLKKMIQKAKKGIAVLETSDVASKEKAIAMRKKKLGEEEYKRRYEGLDHLYYHRDWFVDMAKKYDCTVTIENQCIENYPNNAYRFNVFLNKRA